MSASLAAVTALDEADSLRDFRTPDIMRFGFTPLYLRYRDAFDAAGHMHDILRTETWREPRFAVRSVVT